jgi:hypothetical protein
VHIATLAGVPTPSFNQNPTMGSVNPNTTSVVPARPSNAPAVLSSTSTTIQPAPIPILALTILNGMFSTLSNDAKFSNLCMSKDNWPKWSQKIVEVMEMSELNEYIHRMVPAPDINADLTSFKHWKGNNKKLIRFLKAFVKDGEKSFLATENVHTAWQNLLARHKKQGPTTQVHLIQEVLSISYTKDVSTWVAMTDCICDLCTRIFAQAIPTFAVLFMVAMLNALERDADHIHSEMTSHYISNPTATSAPLSTRIEQEIVYKTCREGAS